jgi:multidrug efflux pump subunit AcrA (membrane-fusion protein)
VSPTREPEAAAKQSPAEPPAVSSTPTSPAQVLAVVRTLKLEVTLIAPTGERWAVINGATYREGDAIAGLEISEIQEGKVRLRQRDITCLLRMD